MSEKLCTLRTQGGGGGAKQTETVLWTNSSPSSSSGFAAQTVTLSDDINNYDYIKIIGAVDYSHLTGNCEGGMIISSADTAKIVTAPCFSLSLSAISGSSNYTRPISFPSSSSVGFGNCLPLRSSTTANTYCIPLSIIGIKNMGGIRTNEKYDILPFKSVSGNAIPTFATKGRAKAIWMPYMFQATSAHRSFVATNVNPATGEIDNDSYPWYIDTSNLNNYGQLSGFKFVVTDSSVTLTASPSSSNLYMGLTYTY